MEKNKKRNVIDIDPNGWMTTFSDLIMLLLTFFVMLLSMSSMDDLTIKKMFSVLMGALGMAILVRDYYLEHEHETVFRGLEVSDIEFTTSAFNCGDCPNNCEIVQVKMPEYGNKIIARWGSRCGKWDQLT